MKGRYNWIERLQDEPEWKGPGSDVHSKKYVFTEEQGNTLAEIVIDLTQNYKERMKNNKFRFITRRFIDANHIETRRNFNISPRWISQFRARHLFTKRRAHYKKRPTASIKDINNYIEKVQNLWTSVDHRYIVNADECPWHLHENGGTTWGIKGQENVIIDGEKKQCFTLLASVDANDNLLPPVFLAAGSSTAVETNWFGESHPIQEWNRTKNWRYVTDHTDKGWTNREFWSRYLDFLRKHISGDDEESKAETIYLICDSYRVHFPGVEEDDPIALALRRNNIELIKVPEGATELFQPLDCRFFGALKSHVARVMINLEINNLAKYFDGKTIDPDYQKLDLEKSELSGILVSSYWELETGQAIYESWNTAIFMNAEW